MKKKLVTGILCTAMAASLAACGSSSSSSTASSEAATTAATETAAAAETTADTAATEAAAADGKTYKVGVCQLVQHEALDAATQGFEDALKDALGDSVTSVVFLIVSCLSASSWSLSIAMSIMWTRIA